MSDDLDDVKFVEALENCTLPASQFPHAGHVRLTWIYLRTNSLPQTLEKIWTGIQRFAEASGHTRLFNETITVFFTLLIYQRVKNNPALTWNEFRETNPDLFDFKKCVSDYYDFDFVKSEAARTNVILPRKNPNS